MTAPRIGPTLAPQMPMQRPASASPGSGQALGSTSRSAAGPSFQPPSANTGSADTAVPRPRASPSDATAPAAAPPRATLPAGKASQSPEALWKAARDFEAMVIGQLLKPMFETVDNSKSPFSGGHGEQAFKPMIVEEMAKKIAAGGGFGLSQPIYAQMLRMQEGVPR